jgi:maltooligosyltrehalose trehalohydrolase
MIFEVWTPTVTAVELDVPGGRRPMSPGQDGWWSAEVPEAGHGTRYGFVLDGDGPYPDPRSRWQPEGIFGPSAVYDHAHFTWTDHGWHPPATPTPVPAPALAPELEESTR